MSMLMDELKQIVRENGIVGAGGAGFPSYAKMTDKADTIILNCVECEPLLKLHKQLLAAHADEIVQMLDEIRTVMGADEAVIGIKKEHGRTIQILQEVLREYPGIRICAVRSAYPMGDEVNLIYEAVGRVISPGGLPMDEQVVVYNTETVYNMYRAVYQQTPVVDKLVSVVGEVRTPATFRLPLGMSVKEAVALAGGPAVANPAYVMGGPMMGKPGTENTVITKTTNAVIVLPQDHTVVTRFYKNMEVERRRAASSCCQCRTCTDLCTRHLLGHPIEPHRIMRAAANQDTSDLSVFINAAYCSGCGACENYACPQGLSPRSMIAEFKAGLRAAGIRPEKAAAKEVDPNRELKKIPVHRLKEKLGLGRYDVEAPLREERCHAFRVRLPLSQHIGAAAVPSVEKGEIVCCGQKIADAAQGLSVALHSPVDGVVEQVTDKEIWIRAHGEKGSAKEG